MNGIQSRRLRIGELDVHYFTGGQGVYRDNIPEFSQTLTKFLG